LAKDCKSTPFLEGMLFAGTHAWKTLGESDVQCLSALARNI